MHIAFNRNTGKIGAAMTARDLAEALGYRIFGIECAVAYFPHISKDDPIGKVGEFRVVRNGDGVALVIA